MVPTAAYLLVLCEGSFAVAVAIGVGVYLRWSDWRQVAADESARTGERLQVAHELHDMLGHHVTGMVVRAQAARHVSILKDDVAVAALESIESRNRRHGRHGRTGWSAASAPGPLPPCHGTTSTD